MNEYGQQYMNPAFLGSYGGRGMAAPIKLQPVASMYNPQVMNQFVQSVAQRQQMFNKAASMIPAEIAQVASIPTLDKEQMNSQINNFISDANNLVQNKYNGDYSAAAPELATLIARERTNPFFEFNRQKVQSAQEEQKMRAQLGLNYLSNMNPSGVSYEEWQKNPDIFSKYTPMNRLDIVKDASLFFSNLKNTMLQSYQGEKANGLPGYLAVVLQKGFKNMDEVKNFLLNKPAGREWFNQYVNQHPYLKEMDPNTVFNAVMEGAASGIGGTQVQFLKDLGATGPNILGAGFPTVPSFDNSIPNPDNNKTKKGAANVSDLAQGAPNNVKSQYLINGITAMAKVPNSPYNKPYTDILNRVTPVAVEFQKVLQEPEVSKVLSELASEKKIELGNLDDIVEDPLGIVPGTKGKTIIEDYLDTAEDLLNKKIKAQIPANPNVRQTKAQIDYANSLVTAKHKIDAFKSQIRNDSKAARGLYDQIYDATGGDFNVTYYTPDKLAAMFGGYKPATINAMDKYMDDLLNSETLHNMVFYDRPPERKYKIFDPGITQKKQERSDLYKSLKGNLHFVGVGALRGVGAVLRVKDNDGNFYTIRPKSEGKLLSVLNEVFPTFASAEYLSYMSKNLLSAADKYKAAGYDLDSIPFSNFLGSLKVDPRSQTDIFTNLFRTMYPKIVTQLEVDKSSVPADEVDQIYKQIANAPTSQILQTLTIMQNSTIFNYLNKVRQDANQ